MPRFNKENQKMGCLACNPVGLGNTRISTDYVMPRNLPRHWFPCFCRLGVLRLVGEIFYFTLELSPTCWAGVSIGKHMAVSREIFGHNQSRSQSVTC